MNQNKAYPDNNIDTQNTQPDQSENDLINKTIGQIKPQRNINNIIKILLSSLGILICSSSFLIGLKADKEIVIDQQIVPIMEIVLYIGLSLMISIMLCIIISNRNLNQMYKNLQKLSQKGYMRKPL